MQKYCGYCKNYIFEKCFKLKKNVSADNIGCDSFAPCVEYQIALLEKQLSNKKK